MNKIKGFITITAFSLMVLCLPAIASAQYGGNGGWNNGGNNNGGYNNGQYGGYGNNNGYSRDVRSTVRDLKERSKNFEKMIDRDRNNNNNNNGGYNNGGYNNGGYNNGGYNNGGYNNGGYGNNGGYNNNNDQRKALKKMADRFKDAADNLDDKYDNGRDMYKSSDEAQRVLNLGSQLDQALYNYGSSSYLRNEWNQIQRDLRVISDAYRYNNNNGRGNGNGNGNGRGNNNGTWNNGNKPSWWPF